jgi:hypothetical protein
MANTFIRKVQKGIGTDANGVRVGAYTVAASPTTKATVIGLSISNTTASAIDVDVVLSQADNSTSTDVSLGTNIPLPSGSTIVLFGGDQKLVMEGGDMIKVRSSASGSCDCVMSILEIT